MRVRLVFLLATAVAALAVAGCGGGNGGSGEDPASVAPAGAPLFVEVAVHPEGKVKANVESLFETVTGIDTNLAELIVSELESSALDSGEKLDFAKEVEPWLGKEAGIFFERYDGNDFTGYGIAVQTTDPGATQEFVDKQTESGDGTAKDGSYEGVDYKVEEDDGTTIGVVGNLLVFAEDEQTFKDAVDASGGESLSESDAYGEATAGRPSDSFADVYVDVGGLIQQNKASIEPQVLDLLEQAGIEPEEATVDASLLPGSDQLEIDVRSDLGAEGTSAAGASDLLGKLPADSVAAFAGADFGKSLQEGLDELDAQGVPGQIPPHKLKSTMKAAGFDLEKFVGSLGDVGAFVTGSGEADLGGALVLATNDPSEAKNTVGNLGLLLRSTGTPGVTALGGKASGFSVRSADLGRKPLVVAAEGERIAIAYGPAAAAAALQLTQGKALSESSAYKEAVASLGGTPITGFVDAPGALRLAEGLVSGNDAAGLEKAKPYLSKASFLAIGGDVSDGVTTAKLILGFEE